MQDDITWGVKYLVDQGIADPKRVGIMGGSYGGYATLAGVAFTPDLYSAAVAIVAPSNLSTLLKSIPPYWEAGRQIFYKRMGDPNTPEGTAQLNRQSPLFSADKIKTPLMVVQGANDPRVNKREADQIVVALRDRNYPVQYLLADDEGHGFARPVNNMAMFAAAEKFLSQYLGGRYQESMTPEVTKRLSEITVDPKTVTVTAPSGMSSGPTSDISGKWGIVANTPDGQTVEVLTEFKQAQGSLSGTTVSYLGNGSIDGCKVSGRSFTCTLHAEINGDPVDFGMEATVEGDTMKGTFANPAFGQIPFTGTRTK
jgi:dienelactone hydrolase